MNDTQHTQGTTQPANRTPAIIGFLIAGAAILGASLIASTRDRSGPDVPPLRIIAPAHGDTITGVLVLRFETPAPLHLDPRFGWVADDLHLHAMLDAREIMPAAADIREVQGGFEWRIEGIEEGSHRVNLTWAGRNHRNVRTPADTVVLHVVGRGQGAVHSDHRGH